MKALREMIPTTSTLEPHYITEYHFNHGTWKQQRDTTAIANADVHACYLAEEVIHLDDDIICTVYTDSRSNLRLYVYSNADTFTLPQEVNAYAAMAHF